MAQGKGCGIVTAVPQVIVMAQVQSLAWECLRAMDLAEKKKKRRRKENATLVPLEPKSLGIKLVNLDFY